MMRRGFADESAGRRKIAQPVPSDAHRANAIWPDRAPSVKVRAVAVGTMVGPVVATTTGCVAVGVLAWAVGPSVGPGLLPPITSTAIRAIATTTAPAPRPRASGEMRRAGGGGGGGVGGGGAGFSSFAHFRQ